MVFSKHSFLAGMVLGGVVASGVWIMLPGPTQAEYDVLQQTLTNVQAENNALATQYRQYETDAAQRHELLLAQLALQSDAIAAQKEAFGKQIAALQTEQKTLVVTKKKLDTQVEKLTTTAVQQKKVLDNSKELYQQQLLLQKQLALSEADVKKAQRTAEEFKQACDEFKSGTSWNWVSQADCDKYEAKLNKVKEAKSKQVDLQTELEALNKKIDIELPRPTS